MGESCFFRVSLCDRLFGRVRSLSFQDRAHAAQVLPFGRREQGGLGLDHQRGLRRESGLKRRDFLCSELKQNIEKWDDLFLRGRTHLGLPVVVSGQGRLPATVMGGSQIVMPAK